MQLVVSFYGMCLCVLEGRKPSSATAATVVLLNGAASLARARNNQGVRPPLPYHHPLLFVPARHVDPARATWSPVPTPESLVDIEGLTSGRQIAWSLSGLDLTLGRGRGISLYETQRAEGALLPNPKPGDRSAYHDWRRIPDLAKIAPGARLRPGFMKIGANALGLVRFRAGELRGATPKNVEGSAAAWHFSSGFTQVITDRFEFRCELPGNEIAARSFAGGKPQIIRLKGRASSVIRLAVVHEATPYDVQRVDAERRTRPATSTSIDLPHYTAFYDALTGASAAALQPPHRVPGGDTGPLPVIETPQCPPALI